MTLSESENRFTNQARQIFFHFQNSIKNSVASLAVVFIVLALNFIFYSWNGSNVFYLGMEFLLLFLLLLSSPWASKTKRKLIIAFSCFLLFFGMDLLFALTIVLQEGYGDKINLFVAALDITGIFFTIYWFLDQF